MQDNNSFKISVIVTTYNTSDYLADCIDSVINNTYKNLEIILVDDASTDNSLEICRRYEAKDSRIKVISQKNSGVSSARNTGIAMVSGGGGYTSLTATIMSTKIFMQVLQKQC